MGDDTGRVIPGRRAAPRVAASDPPEHGRRLRTGGTRSSSPALSPYQRLHSASSAEHCLPPSADHDNSTGSSQKASNEFITWERSGKGKFLLRF